MVPCGSILFHIGPCSRKFFVIPRHCVLEWFDNTRKKIIHFRSFDLDRCISLLPFSCEDKSFARLSKEVSSGQSREKRKGQTE